MQRLLVLLFTLTFVTAGAAAPAVECVSDDSAVGSGQRSCCGQRPTAVTSAGPCCTVSTRPDRAVTESRTFTGKHNPLEPVAESHVDRLHAPTDDARMLRVGSQSPPRGVPIYLEQLSLLI